MSDLTQSGMRADYKIPPESSGSPIFHYKQWVFKVTNLSGEIKFPATFQLLTSGISGVLHTATNYQDGVRLLVSLDEISPLDGFVDGEQITIATNMTILTGTLKRWEHVLLNASAIASATQPQNSLAIDRAGAASVRFDEGQAQFDAFGLLKVSNVSRIADYAFRYDALSLQFQELKTGVGSLLTYLPNESAVALDVGVGATDFISYTTNNYHTYTPGMGQYIISTVAIGDGGKTGAVRRWGYFDDENGLFFELNGLDLCVVMRSTTSGVTSDTKVFQSEWSNDHLDGAGGELNQSEIFLDVTKLNTYWIDFAWLGAGRVRFGIISNAERITVHTFDNSNSWTTPFMGTADLPFRIEQRNTATTISPSRMKLVAASILTDGLVDPDNEQIHSRYVSWVSPTSLEVGDIETPVVALRASQFFNGKINRKKLIPKRYFYFVNGAPVEVTLRLAVSQIYAGGTWIQAHPSGTGEFNVTGTPLIPGELLTASFLNIGATEIPALPDFNSRNSFMTRAADGSTGIFVIISARSLVPGQLAEVKVGLDWVEI